MIEFIRLSTVVGFGPTQRELCLSVFSLLHPVNQSLSAHYLLFKNADKDLQIEFLALCR
jgi:hypothetical protein